MTPLAILSMILQLLPAIEELSVDLQTVLPIAKKLVSGDPVTAADLQALQAVQVKLDAEVASGAASIEGGVNGSPLTA